MSLFFLKLKAACADCALVLGTIWLWVGHLFTPSGLEHLQTILQWLTTLIVFVLALIRFKRVLFNRAKPEFEDLR